MWQSKYSICKRHGRPCAIVAVVVIGGRAGRLHTLQLMSMPVGLPVSVCGRMLSRMPIAHSTS
jgi:hypothetical protein